MPDNNRIEHIAVSLGYLAHATQAEPTDETLSAYTVGLESFDTATIAEACTRLASSERRFPALASVREMCREVLRIVEVQSDALSRTEKYAVYAPMSQVRAKEWQDHLKAVVLAKRNGTPAPAPMSPLDTTDPRTLYRCHACRDTGWIEGQCPGGPSRSCGRSHTHRFVTEGKKAYFEGSCRSSHSFVRRCSCARQVAFSR